MTDTLAATLVTLFRELVDGPPTEEAYMLNGGDRGLLRSLEALSAAAASRVPAGGGASIAAHVDHLRYGLSLMNRWSRGEGDPFSTADWTASWRRVTVDDAAWATLRKALAEEAHAWRTTLAAPRERNAIELNGIVGSVAHLAYHLGAIRQIDRAIRGPAAV